MKSWFSAKLLRLGMIRLFNTGSPARASTPNHVPVIIPQRIVAALQTINRLNSPLGADLTMRLTPYVPTRNNSPYPPSPMSIAKKMVKDARNQKLTSNSRYPGTNPINLKTGSIMRSQGGFLINVGISSSSEESSTSSPQPDFWLASFTISNSSAGQYPWTYDICSSFPIPARTSANSCCSFKESTAFLR